jgi:uncharacterized membrane protein (DUF441 family)
MIAEMIQMNMNQNKNKNMMSLTANWLLVVAMVMMMITVFTMIARRGSFVGIVVETVTLLIPRLSTVGNVITRNSRIRVKKD